MAFVALCCLIIDLLFVGYPVVIGSWGDFQNSM